MLRSLWNRWRYRRELSPVEQWVINEGTVYYMHHEVLSPQASFARFADALGYLLSQVAKGSESSW